jgi:hypothetical protein
LSRIIRQFIVTWLLVSLLGACSREIQLSGDTPAKVDFSGSWELNYQLSESIRESAELLRLMAIVEARRASGRMDQGWPVLPSFELVELADSISQVTVLEIEQDPEQIEVKRGEEFPLTCTFGNPGPDATEDDLGTEVCGWYDHQLVFWFRLPDNLSITQELTLGPGGNRLNIATTVRTPGAGQTFTLNRVYTRFVPLADEFECEYTLARGKSCRRATPDEPVSVTL